MNIANFNKLKEEILNCRLCEQKFGFEPHPIFTGKINSKIMQISQAPSLTVYKTLKPFNDASGKKLRSEWYNISDEVFSLKEVRIATNAKKLYDKKAY